MRRGAPPAPEQNPAALATPGERTKILSSGRLKLSLSLMLLGVIAVLMTLIWVLVGQIFDQLNPRVRDDLVWKTERGVAELSHSTELGVLTADVPFLERACQRYTSDADVMALLVTGTTLEPLYSRGSMPLAAADLFDVKPGAALAGGEFFAAWLPIEIEGQGVGRVALVVSTQRLQAGMELRSRILAVAAGGLMTALALALGFVHLRIIPVLRLTEAAFAELQDKTRAALESARIKGEFMANISHEIRTPLNGIIGMVELLRGMSLTGPVQRYLQTLDVSSRALLSVVNDVLDFSKIEAGKLEIRNSSVDPLIIAQEVCELYAERAHSSNLEILCGAARDLPARCALDGERLRQVLSNLVSNALKFTPAGEVFVGLSVDSGGAGRPQLHVEVVDTGIGIAAADQERLFQAFSQVDGSSVRSRGGTGLGLVIAQRLVVAMGGKIGLESDPGKGSRFWFRLPLVIESAAVEQTPSLEGRSVLLVDGNARSLARMGDLLEGWGARAHAEPSGLAALDRMQCCANGPDAYSAVLIAEKTLDVTGLEFVELGHALAIPLVFLRQRTPLATLEGLLGVHALLDKPIRPRELYTTLAAALQPRAVQPRPAPAANTDRAPSDGPSRRVLIVDDNEINRFVAHELVILAGLSTSFACDGREAFEAARSDEYGLILMDCQMPGMDGYESTRRIREYEGELQRHTPIVALTAHALAGERERCLSAGMDDFATKPIRPEMLRELLARWTAPGEMGGLAEGVATKPTPAAPAQSTTSPPNSADVALPLAAVERSTELIELFIARTPELLGVLDRCGRAGSAEDVRRAAHKLKGSCLAIGASQLALWAASVQRESETGNLSGARADIARIVAEYGQVERLLRFELGRDAPLGPERQGLNTTS